MSRDHYLDFVTAFHFCRVFRCFSNLFLKSLKIYWESNARTSETTTADFTSSDIIDYFIVICNLCTLDYDWFDDRMKEDRCATNAWGPHAILLLGRPGTLTPKNALVTHP